MKQFASSYLAFTSARVNQVNLFLYFLFPLHVSICGIYIKPSAVMISIICYENQELIIIIKHNYKIRNNNYVL